MFLKEKKVLSEDELKQKRLELDASLRKAEETKKKFIDDRVAKLRRHASKVEAQRKGKHEKDSQLDQFHKICDFWKELSKSSSLNEFQKFMQKPEIVSEASDLISFIESRCPKEGFESVKSRPKIFMSLALLANYPNEVIPNANPEEQDLLTDSKIFYDHLGNFFDYSAYSIEEHKEVSLMWMQIIHKFDEWLVKDKKVLFDKMMLDFMTWTKSIGALSINSDSWAEWEPHSIKYQNEIIKRIYEVFGKEHVKIIENEVAKIKETFVDAELFIEFDQETNGYKCRWCKKIEIRSEAPENDQFSSTLPDKVKTTNIQILHGLMLKENINFESILQMSGKSLSEISQANREGLSKLISILGNQSDTVSIASSIQEIFEIVTSILYDLAGDNEDYCKEIRLTDSSVDSVTWISDSTSLLQWTLSMCRRCCAPARDQTCNDLEMCIGTIIEAETSQNLITAFINTFTILFDLLNLMRSDFCNFRMKFLVAQIEGKNIAETRELEEFKSKFGSNISKTEKWLRSKRKEESKPIEILADSFLALIDPTNDDITESNVPETFYLDVERIRELRKKLMTSLAKEAGLIYVKNHLRMHKEDLEDIEAVMQNLNRSMESISNESEIEALFEKCAQNLKLDSENLLLRNIKRVFSNATEDKVFILLKNRELFKIRTILLSNQMAEPGTIGEKSFVLFNYNKACYSTIYDEIILKK